MSIEKFRVSAFIVLSIIICSKIYKRGINYVVDTVFPQIVSVSAETILFFWNLECGKYSRKETIQGWKIL